MKAVAQSLFTHAEQSAAEDTDFPHADIIRVREKMRNKASQIEKQVQYYALLEDSLWPAEERDERIFGATRLLYEYVGPTGRQLPDRTSRIDTLKGLILKLAGEAKTLPIIQKIRKNRLKLQ